MKQFDGRAVQCSIAANKEKVMGMNYENNREEDDIEVWVACECVDCGKVLKSKITMPALEFCDRADSNPDDVYFEDGDEETVAKWNRDYICSACYAKALQG